MPSQPTYTYLAARPVLMGEPVRLTPHGGSPVEGDVQYISWSTARNVPIIHLTGNPESYYADDNLVVESTEPQPDSSELIAAGFPENQMEVGD